MWQISKQIFKEKEEEEKEDDDDDGDEEGVQVAERGRG